MKIRIIKLLLLLVLILLPQIKGTSSAYADAETTSMSMQAATWDVAGDVVINEIMWMGSDGKPFDEWIELRNMTNHEISLDNWNIEGAGSGSNAITLSGSIPAYGYFLISHYDSASSDSKVANTIVVDNIIPGISLANGGEVLTLKSDIGIPIDQTPVGAWVAGANTTVHESMERNDDPSTGWHTCIDVGCNDTIFWDTEGIDYGTPKAPNLSDNDQSITMAFPLTLSPLPQENPSITDFYLGSDGKTVSFTLSHIGAYVKLNYVLTYSSYDTVRGIGPSEVMFDGDEEYQSKNFDLATCSSGICTYDQGISNFQLEVTLVDSHGKEIQLTKTIE